MNHLPSTESTHVPSAFGELVSQEGHTIRELSAAAPLLVVFLRHLGCPFCRETLSDLENAKPALDEAGVALALVHMTDDETAARVFGEYRLDVVPRFSDKERRAYRAMELGSVPIDDVFGATTWRRAYQAAVRDGHGVGPALGNVLQMPGVFVVDQGQIVAGLTYVRVSDRPDYHRLVAERAFAVA